MRRAIQTTWATTCNHSAPGHGWLGPATANSVAAKPRRFSLERATPLPYHAVNEQQPMHPRNRQGRISQVNPRDACRRCRLLVPSWADRRPRWQGRQQEADAGTMPQGAESLNGCQEGQESRMKTTQAQIEQKMAEKRAGRLSTCPESVKALFSRIFGGVGTRNQAIKAMCLECVGFDRLAVTDCTAYACPLWRYRPFQKK